LRDFRFNPSRAKGLPKDASARPRGFELWCYAKRCYS
jgi:hypothetical protein